jgi:N-acetylneuraminate synthase
LSTPFSRAAVERLQRFGVAAFKIGSGECNNFPLVKHIAKTGKPLIVSTGMNSFETIDRTVNILRSAKVEFALLHCTNLYPTPPELVRLGSIIEMQMRYPDAVVGLSDHTIDNYACLGAVALGASIVERHFTDSKSRIGPDICCSMDPHDLKELIYGVNTLFKERDGFKGRIPEEKITEAFAYGSVVATKDLQQGDVITEENIWVRRPSGGDFGSGDYEFLIGKTVTNFVKANSRIKKADLE